MDKGANHGFQEQPCTEHTFLFVNESTARGGFKAGRQREVRSHIRQHVMKRHKKEKQQRDLDQKGKVKRGYAVIAPLETSGQKLAELTTEDTAFTPVASSNTQPKPNKIKPILNAESTSEHTVNDLSSTDSPDESNWLGDHVNPTLDSPRANILPRKPELGRCLHCGAVQDISQMINKPKMKERSPIRNQSDSGNVFEFSSPLQILGAGRVDPFLSYPGEGSNGSTKELMDHAVTYFLPGLVPNEGNEPVNPVSKAWFSASLKLPMLFHALVFAGAIHLDYMRWSAIYPNSKVILTHKIAVIQQLNMVLANPKEAQKDEVILAILILSSHEAREQTESKTKPFNSPLASVQWLNVYGNIKYVPEHTKAVADLVNMRGGIENLKLHGLAVTIACGDIISSTNTLSKPGLPPLKELTDWIEYVVKWATAPTRFPVQLIGKGFEDLEPYGLTPDAIYVFLAMGCTTNAIDTYIQGKPAGLRLGQVSLIRTAVHQRLLLLPPVDELTEPRIPRNNVYEACRSAALIYSIAIIFPIPNTFQLFQTLVSRLKACIEKEQISHEAYLSDLLLWLLVVGGIAALEKPERVWYVSQLVDYVKKWDIHEWSSVEKILGQFLWLESACSEGGRRLWLEVMDRNLNPFDI